MSRTGPYPKNLCGLCEKAGLERSSGDATFEAHRAPCGRLCVGGEHRVQLFEDLDRFHLGRDCRFCRRMAHGAAA